MTVDTTPTDSNFFLEQSCTHYLVGILSHAPTAEFRTTIYIQAQQKRYFLYP